MRLRACGAGGFELDDMELVGGATAAHPRAGAGAAAAAAAAVEGEEDKKKEGQANAEAEAELLLRGQRGRRGRA